MTNPQGWRCATLGELEAESSGVIQTGPFGSQLHSSDYSVVGTPVVMPTNIRDLRISTDGIARVSVAHVERLSRHKLRAGDIVYSRRGDVEKCALVTLEEESWLCGTGCLLVRVAGPQVDARYLAYALSLPETRDWITSHAVGATMPNLNTQVLREVPVPLPPIQTQRAIAATLGALDDKIESNRRAADAVNRLVNLHFKQAVERHVVDSIPLGEVATFTKGHSYRGSELQESATALVTLKSFDRNGGYRHDGLKPYIGPFRPEQVIKPGELVVAQTDLTQGAEVVGRGVRVPPVSEFSLLVASLDLAIVRPQPPMPVEYLLGLLSSEAFRQYCRSRVTGTTVLHLAKDAMPTWAAPVVPFEEQLEFAGKARVLLERMDALNHESVRLAGVRDALLPELLSGRIQMPSGGSSIAEPSSALVGSRGT